MAAKPNLSELQVVLVNYSWGPRWMLTGWWPRLYWDVGQVGPAPQLQHTSLQLSLRTHNNSPCKLSYSHTALTPRYIIQSTMVTILGLKMIHSHSDWSVRYQHTTYNITQNLGWDFTFQNLQVFYHLLSNLDYAEKILSNKTFRFKS